MSRTRSARSDYFNLWLWDDKAFIHPRFAKDTFRQRIRCDAFRQYRHNNFDNCHRLYYHQILSARSKGNASLSRALKIRPFIFLFIVVMAALIALVLWHGKRPVETPPTAVVENNATPPAATVPNAPVSAPVHSNAPIVKTAEGADLSKTLPMSKEERAVGLLSTYNDVPINFYGRVEDQFGSPVVGAVISYNVRVMNGQESTVNRGEVTTDGNGFFNITGYRGQDLGLSHYGLPLRRESNLTRQTAFAFAPPACPHTVPTLAGDCGKSPLPG
jgi:hypothetical protein